jgi:hypothetical protein
VLQYAGQYASPAQWSFETIGREVSTSEIFAASRSITKLEAKRIRRFE